MMKRCAVMMIAMTTMLMQGAAALSDAPLQEQAEAPAADAATLARLLAAARAQRAGKGCAAAVPQFRVVAAMGAGQEAAQHELAACLLLLDGANATDARLLRQEAQFWLLRAAHAGNARAQRALAMDAAAPTSADHDPATALQWALVYEANPQAALYGEDRLPPTLVAGLRASLSPAEAAAASDFAAAFTPLAMARFEPPPRPRRKRGERPDGFPAPERRPR
jgi:hypothetical protein